VVTKVETPHPIHLIDQKITFSVSLGVFIIDRRYEIYRRELFSKNLQKIFSKKVNG